MKEMFRIISIVMSSIVILYLGYFFVDRPLPHGEQLGLVAVVLLASMTSLMYGFMSPRENRAKRMVPEIIQLEIESRKATLRKRIADSQRSNAP